MARIQNNTQYNTTKKKQVEHQDATFRKTTTVFVFFGFYFLFITKAAGWFKLICLENHFFQ